MNAEEIQKIIAAGLPCEGLSVQGDDYPQALIVSSRFEGQSRVKRQQMVNALLRSYFDSGELHALSMKTLSPEEWSALRG